MVKLDLQVRHDQPLETQYQLQKLFPILTESEIQPIAEKIGLVLYAFKISRKNESQTWKVFKSHHQIMIFLQKVQKKFKIKISFEKMQKKDSLNEILNLPFITQLDWFKQFFEVEDKVYQKVASVKLKKRSGGRYFRYQLCGGCGWRLSNFIITSDGILYFHKSKDQIKEFLHFGKDFQWKIGQFFSDFQIVIYSYHRKLTLKATTERQYFLFIYYLNSTLRKYKKNQQKYRFNSFAPVRQNNSVQFFVDGAEYFAKMAAQIQNAKEEVFICGWWVSPEFHLVRPCKGKNLQYRLDKLLKKIASKNNVKVYIIVYYESSFLTNDSSYTIQALTKLHSNIKVLRHPQIVLPTFWSHHEKLVVIDQQEAFLGGLDLCYGRYDDSKHLINDNSVTKYPGIQYNNCRVRDFTKVKQYWNQNVPRIQQRLPWHDITLFVKGIVVKDLSRHFIQYWNYASYQTHYAQRLVLISKQTNIFKTIKNIAERIVDRKGKKKQTETDNQKLESEFQKQIDDLGNLELKKKSKSEKYFSFKEKFSSSLSQKQAYHLPVSQKQQEKELRNEQLFSTCKMEEDRGEEKVEQEQNSHETEVQKQKKILEEREKKIKNSILEIAQIEISIDEEQQERGQYLEGQYLNQKKITEQKSEKGGIQVWIKKFISKGKLESQEQIAQIRQEEQNDNCQVLRSASQWSIGCKASNVEKSISTGYASIIMKAKKFIYIENQFFISATKFNGVVKNEIMNAISKRVIQAINMKEDFRVIVLMPLIPGFAGELDDPEATLPRVIMHWQYKTICRGQNSLFERVKSLTPYPEKYIQFYSLRNHGIVNDEPKTEIIYLHSKMIIVDDRQIIIGSANINDRSMEGDRDSELCLMVDDNLSEQVKIGGQIMLVHPNIHRLRVKLWQEHFCLTKKQCEDPLNKEVRVKMVNIAKKNTSIYRNLFGCYPDDSIKKISEISPFKKKEVDTEEYQKKSVHIIGHIVEFPLNFLCEENLTSLHPNQIST